MNLNVDLVKSSTAYMVHFDPNYSQILDHGQRSKFKVTRGNCSFFV